MRQEARYFLPGIENKTVVVTGGSKGIGKVISQIMANLRAAVAIIDTDEEKGSELVENIKKDGGSAAFYRGDISNEDSMDSCMNQINAEQHGIDILINNAGITYPLSFEKITLNDWRKIIDINLTGTFISSRAAIPFMVHGGGCIVMVSSGSAITGSGGSLCYAASKGGVNSMVRGLSRELAPKGIRINGVAPRTIQGEKLLALYSEKDIKTLEGKIPVRRLGTPENVADVVAFLASDLSEFITGETILVDGGRTYGG